jgi:insulysin
LEDVGTLPYLYRSYKPELYTKILETLTPENMLAVLQSRSVETDRKEKFYGAEYSVSEVRDTAFDKLRNPPHVSGLHYPERNSFIPYNLTLKAEEPRLVRDDAWAKVWFKFDNRFKQPKVYIKLRIETPRVYDTVRNTALSKLYEAMVQEGLNEIAYPMQMAGIGYSLGINKKGVILSFGGYSEKITDLLSLVTKNLTRININEVKFDDLKKAMIRSLENRKLAQANSRAAYFNRLLWLVKEFNEKELIQGMESITLDDLKAFPTRLYERVFVTGVVYGNWEEKEVQKNLDLLLSELKSKPLPAKDRYEEKVEVLEQAEKILFSRQVVNNNNALYYSLQVGKMGLSEHATTSMVSSIVETDFYTQLRTNQQLGYIVWSYNDRVEDRLFFKFVIQSADYGPFELRKRVESWMERAVQQFDDLTDKEFEKHRKGLILAIQKKGESIGEVAAELYGFATREKGNFKFKQQMIEAMKRLKKEEVVAAAQKILVDPKTPKIAVLIRSQNNKEPVPKGILTTVPQFKKRKNKHAGTFQGRKS